MTLLHILHLEDNPFDAKLVKIALRPLDGPCTIRVVADQASYESALADAKWDLIFCDYNVPRYNGRLALEAARLRCPETPVIMISGALSEEEAVVCLHYGAVDYLLKQSMGRLPAAVERAVRLTKEREMRRAAEQRFRSLLEVAPDAIVIVDSRGNIAMVNSQAEFLFGYQRSEMIGRPLEMLVPHRHRKGHEAQVSRFLTERRARKMAIPSELFALRRDGTEVPVEILLSPLDEAGETLTIAAVRDVTERRKLEAQLSRTKRLESVGAFAGNIAHDLNNALTPALLSLDLLTGSNRETSQLVATVQASVQRGADMLRQLLVFSKGSCLEPKLVNSMELLGEVRDIVKLSFPENIDVRAHSGDDLKQVWGDRTQLYQLLMNLCLNARDAMPDGGALTIVAENIQIDAECVRVMPDTRPGPYVMWRVSDTGHGMPADVLDRVFEPFFTTKGYGQGTGLGLSIVMGIAKSHAGFINAYSTPGSGSTFAVYIPADPSATPPAVVADHAKGGL